MYHATLTTPNFQKLFQGLVRTVPGARMPNFKGVSLAILELFWHLTPPNLWITWHWPHPIFENFPGHVRTIHAGNACQGGFQGRTI